MFGLILFPVAAFVTLYFAILQPSGFPVTFDCLHRLGRNILLAGSWGNTSEDVTRPKLSGAWSYLTTMLRVVGVEPSDFSARGSVIIVQNRVLSCVQYKDRLCSCITL